MSSSDSTYFQSYFDVFVHELMIKDKPRTDAYLKAIKENQHVFKDKVVLDVGCGTGILSFFAAKYGLAKKVYAVEASEMAKYASLFVEHNGLEDVIEVIEGKIEDIQLPIEKVDIIISEWMGFYLLHEGMLESVLYARNKYLDKVNGLLFPSKACIYMSPCEMNDLYKERVEFWNDVYGFDMSAAIPLAMETLARKPYVECIKQEQLLLKIPIIIKELNLMTITNEDLQFIQCECYIQLEDNNIKQQNCIHGFCVWFDVLFEPKEVILSTSPNAAPTHWKQTIIMLPQPLEIPKSGKLPKTILTMTPSDVNPRHYDISIDIPEAFAEEEEDYDLKDLIMKQFLNQEDEDSMQDDEEEEINNEAEEKQQ
ncbi:hypothetical protein ABK040_001933 [Willaertia magna]